MKKIYENDTICAIATAIGGGIGIIRISGDQSFDILDKIFIHNKKKKINYTSHKVYYGFIKDIDEVLVIPMKAPKTYTCEDIVEIHCHGGATSVKMILEQVINCGARLAKPGEFTKRAFLNGRIDLSQAEAVSDIINAKTSLEQKFAINQLGGNLLTKVTDLRNKMLGIIANIEVNIDYPENDIEEETTGKIKIQAVEIVSSIIDLISTSNAGRIIKEGIKTVIIGSPNVGKSSLLNALMKEERAIVTNIPGTTRDILSEYISIGDIPLKIIDTAGIRETEDEIEKIGVEMSKKQAEMAELILVLLDGTKEFSDTDKFILETYNDKKIIVLVNKIDMDQVIDLESLYKYIDKDNVLFISAKNYIGIDNIGECISKMFYLGNIINENNDLVINMRHKECLVKALESLENVLETIDNGFTQEFIAIDLADCYEALGEITGDTIGEDIMDRIFSEFCLGK